MYIIVGSTALDWHGMARKKPIDIDYWTDIEDHDLEGDVKVIPKEILDLAPISDKHYATPDAIYTIKLSHAAYDIFWQKTKADILFLKESGCTLITELYTALLEYWKVEHGDKDFLSLNKTKEDFFTDNVTYVYDHDYLHELVAYPNRPVYESVLKDNHEVLIDREKFDKLPFESRVRMFREEVTVIAAERWLINPQWNGKLSWYRAYMLALQKTVTALTKGWATEFILFNLEHFVKPDYSYFKHLIETIEETKRMGTKVKDLSVFEELLKYAETDILECLVYELAEGDVYWNFDFENEVPYPKSGDKDYWRKVEMWREGLLEVDRLKKEKLESLGLGYNHLKQEGGGEGGGEYCHGVFELAGKIYKAEYSYYSHHGPEYYDILNTLQEVVPVEKTVVVYE